MTVATASLLTWDSPGWGGRFWTLMEPGQRRGGRDGSIGCHSRQGVYRPRSKVSASLQARSCEISTERRKLGRKVHADSEAITLSTMPDMSGY
jgi:hypothetical protein